MTDINKSIKAARLAIRTAGELVEFPGSDNLRLRKKNEEFNSNRLEVFVDDYRDQETGRLGTVDIAVYVDGKRQHIQTIPEYPESDT